MLGIGMVMSSIEIISITLWAVTGNWISFAVGMPIVILLGCLLTTLYYQSIAFICPTCNTVFKPKFKEFFFAMHTPKAAHLTCPQCRNKNWCIESYHINSKTNWKKRRSNGLLFLIDENEIKSNTSIPVFLHEFFLYRNQTFSDFFIIRHVLCYQIPKSLWMIVLFRVSKLMQYHIIYCI